MRQATGGHGREVLKVERAGVGDWARDYGPYPNELPHRECSGLFLYLNANKRDVTLNLDTPTGREILAGLVSRYDVLVHNLHPTEMDRVGMDYATLTAHNDRLVMASITPFGLTGPYRNWKAYDINLAAGGGICEGLGSPDREPLTFGTPEVGYFAGAAAACSIVMALLEQGEQREGQHIDIAEIESMAGLYNGPEALMAVYQWRVTRRTRAPRTGLPVPELHPSMQGRPRFCRFTGGPAVAATTRADGQPRMVAGTPLPQPHGYEQ